MKNLMRIFKHLWQVIKSWFCPSEVLMQKGELVVLGKNFISIPLEGLPCEVHAHFTDEKDIVPCNPQHVDSLEYDVHVSNSHHKKYVLIIKWDVSAVREVKWKAEY